MESGKGRLCTGDCFLEEGMPTPTGKDRRRGHRARTERLGGAERGGHGAVSGQQWQRRGKVWRTLPWRCGDPSGGLDTGGHSSFATGPVFECQ